MMPSEQAGAPASAALSGRRLHPLTLLFGTIRVARRFVVPAVIGGLSAGRGDSGAMITWTLAILAVPALLIVIAEYASFRYRLGAEELLLDSGVLSRTHRVIPVARVQNIEVRQSALERVAGVAELRVETAGGGGATADAVLAVLGRAEAEELRGELLSRRRAAGAGPEQERIAPVASLEPRRAGERSDANGGAARPVPSPDREDESVQLAKLGVGTLAMAGATANEAGLIAAGLIGALQFLDDLPVAPPEWLSDPAALLPGSPGVAATLLILVLILGLLMLGWIVSIVGALVGYHDFTLERAGQELRKRYGLLARREGSVPLDRVQAVRVEESLLRRPLGVASLKIETAGAGHGAGQGGGAEAFLPLANVEQVPRLVAGVFEDLDYAGLIFLPVHPRSRRRGATRLLVVLVSLTVLAAAVAGWRAAWLLALSPLALLIAHWQYRNRGYAVSDGYVAARGGVLNRVTWVVPERKCQVLHLRQSLFQRRHGLATVILDTASGGGIARVVDLALDDATALVERLASRVPAAVRAARVRRRLETASRSA